MRRLPVRALSFLSLICFFAIPRAADAALTIVSPPSSPTFPIGVVQMPLQASGGTAPYTFSVISGVLPPGFAIRSDVPSFFPIGVTAGIIGVATTPTGASPYQFTIQVQDSSASPQTATLAITLHITGENFKDLATLPNAVVNSPYSYTFTVLNGSSPTISLTTNSNPLPAGMSLTGMTLSGTPTTPGSSNFQLQIVDGATTVAENFNLNVQAVSITTPGVLSNATQNTAYNGGTGVQLAAAGGSGTYSYQITSGGLPQGLSLSSTGLISGTVCSCAGPGRYAMGITVTDTTTPTPFSYQQNFAMDVMATVPVLPSIENFSFNDATVGATYSFSVAASGGVAPYTWNVTGLPSGMSFRSGAGTSAYVTPGDVEIWGVPQAVGVYNVTLTATDSSSGAIAVSATMPLRVSPMAYGFSGSNTNLLGTLNTPISPAYQLRVIGGTAGYSAVLSSSSNPLPFGTTLNASSTGGNITGTPVENGNFNFQVKFTDATTPTANTLTSSVNVSVNPQTIQIFNNANLGTYSTGGSNTVNFGFGGCCAQSGTLTWSLANGSTLPTGLSLSASTGQLTGAVATAGTYSFFIQAEDAASNIGVKHFTITFTPVSITTNALGYGNVGTAYTPVQFAATGTSGTQTWSVTSGFLPPGMQLTSGGLLGNVPSSPGQYNFTVSVVDGVGNTAFRGYNLTIYPAGSGPPVSISSGSSLGTYLKGDLEADLYATGGNGIFAWSVQGGSNLPPGLSLRTDPQYTGGSPQAAIIGVATTPGNYSFTLVASSAGQSASQTFTMRITGLNLIEGNNLPDAYGGVAYNYTLTPLNNAGTVTYSISTSNNNAPAWLNINATTGLLSGTPVAPFSNYNFGVTIYDGTDTITRYFNLNAHAIQISCATPACPRGQMPNATQGQTYTLSLSATDPASTAPITYSANNLPNGLTVQNGVITGTVNTNANAGLQAVSITASDGNNSTTQQFSIVVNSTSAQLPRINFNKLNDPIVGQPYSGTIPVCCGGVGPAFTWSVTGLPAGLFSRYAGSGTAGTASGTPGGNVTPGAVEIYGIPQTAGSSTVTVTVTDSSATPQTSSLSFNLHVSPLDQTAALPNGTIGTVYSQALREIGGTTGYTVSLISGALPAGVTLNATTIAGITTAMISGTPIESGNFNIGLRFTDSTAGTASTLTRFFSITIANSSNTNLQINTTTPIQEVTGSLANGNLTMNACCTATPYTWSIVGGALPSGLTLGASTGFITGTNSPAGNYSFLVQVQDANGNTARKQFTLQISSLQITTNSLPYGNQGAQYNGASGLTLTATGGTTPLTWSLQPGTFLPPGLTLSSGGVISGTPGSTGQYFPTFVVTDSSNPANSSSASYVLNVYPAGGGPALVIQTGTNMGTWSVGYTQLQFVATGGTGAYTWSQTAGTLPPGYAIRTDLPSFFSANASAGLIGVGTTPGTYNFTLSVTSGSQTVSQVFSITITALTTKDPNLPDAYVGQPYNGSASGYTMTALNPATGGTVSFSATPSSCSVSFPTNCLPPGLTMSASGQITGTPMAGSAGAYTFNVAVSDGTNTVNHQFVINTYAIIITSGGVMPNATQGQAYSAPALVATGGTGTLTWSSNGLPSGFVLNSSTGVISASSTFNAGPGRYQVNVTVTDQNNVSSVKHFALYVAGVPSTLPQLNFGLTNDLTIGQPSSIDINATGDGAGPFTFTATGLPAGMSIRSALSTVNNNLTFGDGEIWGTPTPSTWTTYNVVVTATDANGVSVSNTFPLHVSPLTSDGLNSGTINVAYSGNLRIIGGTGPYTFVKTVSGSLPDGLTLSTTGAPVGSAGVVSGTPLESGGFNVTYEYADSASTPNTLVHNNGFNISNTSPLQINNSGNLGIVTVNQSYNNTLGVSGCCGSDPLVWSVAGGTIPPGITLSSGGVLGGTPTTAQVAPYTFLVKVQDTVTTTNVGFRQFTMVVTPINLTSSNSLAFGNVSGAYSSVITTSGNSGAITWTLAPYNYLPPGLTLSGSTISGTPTASGSYSFTLIGTDASGNTITRTFSISIFVAGGGPPLSLTNFGPSVGPWSIGTQSIQLAATGGVQPYTYSLTPSATVIPGCRVQTGQPLPTGFPTTATGGYLCLVTTPGTYNTSIRVTDSATPTANTFDRAITVTVSPLILGMQGTLPKGTVNAAYTFNPVATGGVAASGGTGAYTFTATNLPPGLSINSSTGVISGTPSTAGAYNPSITVGNASVTGTVGFGLSMVVNPFAITNTTILPQGTAGATYSQTLTAPGCGTGCTWSVASGSLPTNFNLTTVSGNGLLSTGTNTASTFNGSFTLQASGSNGTTQEIFSLIIAPNTITALSVTTAITSTSQLGASANTALIAAGGTPPYTFSISGGSLPPGISLQTPGDQLGGNLAPGTAYLAGRPTVPGPYNFTVQVTDSTSGTPLTATKAFTWTISPLSIQYNNLPLTTGTLVLGAAYTQPILVVGGSGSYTSWTNPSLTQPLPSGLTLSSTTGVISGTPASTGNVSVPFLITDSSGNTVNSNININVQSSASATVILGGPAYGTVIPLGSTQTYSLNPSGGTGPYTITAVGSLPAGVILETGSELGSSFGAGSYGMQMIFSTPGTYTFTLQAVDSSTPALTGARTYSVIVPGYGPLETSTTLPQGSVGTAYSQQVYSFDNSTTVTWAVAAGSALPPGLSISAAGLISGIPTAAGTYSFALSFGDATGSSSNTFTLKISPVAITTATATAGVLPLASINVPYGPTGGGVTLTSTGGSGTTTWTLVSGTMPSGLSLSGAGVISGTPNGNNGTGLFTITVAATNSGGSISKPYSIFVSQTNPTILDYTPYLSVLNDATLGQFVSYTLVPDGGVPGYTWTVASGSTLPPGLSLVPATSLSGSPGITALAGIPSTAGQYSFNMVLTDSNSPSSSVTRTFTLNVSPISITVSNPPSAKQGTPYSFQFEATGGTGPYTYSLIANPSNSFGQDALPFGLSMNSSGLISGTPTGTGAFNILLTVTDSASPAHTLAKALTITSLNSLGVQITLKNLNVSVDTSLSEQVPLAGSSSTFTWSTLAVTPTPAAPIISGLPPGLTLQSNGTLSGTTTAAGIYQFVIQAVDNSNSSDVVLKTITVNVSPISITAPVANGLFTPSFPAATIGVPYSFAIVAAGGTAPYTFSEAPTYPLPPGITLSASGVLSGTPTQSGKYSIRPIITDATGVQAFYSNISLIVTANGKPPLNQISNGSASDASVGVPYALPLDRFLTGGVAPFTWTVANGSTLPPGMAILAGSAGGSNIIGGTPTVAGTYTFNLSVADSSGQTLIFPVQGFNVSPLTISPGSIPNALRGVSYSLALSASGGTPPYSFQFVQGSLPPAGLSIASGALSGTPIYAGVFGIGITVTDSAATPNTVTHYFDFSVDDAAGEVPSIAVAPQPVNILFIQGSSTTSTPITVSSSSGTLPFNATLYGLPGTTLSTASGTTPGSLNIGFGSLGAGTYNGFLGASSASAVNALVLTPVSITVLAPPPCTYTLSTNSTSSPIGGDSGNINISAGPGCAWTAAASGSAPWISLTGATSGSGNGTVPYTTAANATGSARTGTVTITGSTSSPVFTINQFSAACSFSISPSVISATAAGASATINIVSSGSSCPWTASGLSVSATSGNGSASVNVTIPSTTSATPAPLTATIAGQTLTVNQTGVNCTYTLSAGTATFASTGGAGSVNVTAPAGCAYNTVLGPSWINVTSGGSGTGTGSPIALTYTVDPNSTTLPRSGALTISGQTYAITEQALACSVSLDTSTLGSPFAATGGSGTIGVTTNGSNCSWNAASNSGFATVSPATGFGDGSVTVIAGSNAASTTSRTGSLSISGQNIAFSQAGTTCSYSLLSSSVSMPATGGLATVSVVAPAACTWSAVSNNPTSLTIIASGSSGTADVSFTAAANSSATPITGTLTVAGQTFTVNEAGAPCSYNLAASGSGLLANTSSSGLTVNYTATTSGCSPTVQSFSSWITATNSFTSPNGTVTYAVAANPSGATRTGNIQIGNQVFTVTQNGAACAYSLNSYGISINYLGASGTLLGAADLSSCPSPPDGSTQPFVTVGSLTGTPSLYSLPFTVAPYVSSTSTVRVGQITFGGLLFSVKQTSY